MKKNKILEKIKKNEIRMKPRWWFKAQEAGWRGANMILWLTAGLIVSGIIYWAGVMNVGDLISFGGVGWEMAGEMFPYWWGLGVIVLAVGGGIMYGRWGENYKKTAGIVTTITVAVLVLIAVGLMIIGRRKELEILLWFI